MAGAYETPEAATASGCGVCVEVKGLRAADREEMGGGPGGGSWVSLPCLASDTKELNSCVSRISGRFGMHGVAR